MRLPTGVLIGLVVLLAVPNLASKTVTVDGVGATKTQAVENAQTNAIEKAVGVFVASETITRNFTMAKDMIFSKATGFVKTYKVLSSARQPDKSYTVRIEAEVDAIMDSLVKDEAAVDLLLQWVNRPKFMVIINERDALGNDDMVAETQIIKKLREYNFQVVDRDQIKSVIERDAEIAQLAGDPASAAAMANRFGAQIIVGGKCDVKAMGHPALGRSLSGQANISGKIVKADNAEIVATDTWHGKFVHVDSLTAGKKAALLAADGLVEYLIAETIKEWGHQKANATVVQLSVSGMEYPHKQKLMSYLQYEVEGVSEVTQRGFSAGVGEYQVKFKGTTSDLGGLLYGRDCGGFTLDIYEETGNVLKLKVKQ